MNRQRSKFWRVVVLTGLALALVVAALPLWWPWVLRPVLRAQGVQFATAERQGFARLQLHEVTWHEGQVHFTATRVETATPLAWLWRLTARATNRPPVLSVQQWELTVHPATSPRPTKNSVASVLTAIERTLPSLKKWLPRVVARDGRVRFADQVIEVRELLWHSADLTARVAWPDATHEFQAQLDFGRHASLHEFAHVTLTLPANDLHLEIIVSRRDNLPGVEGFLTWQTTHRLELSAQFAHTGWWPEVATVKGDALVAQAGDLPVPGYQSVSGGLLLQWQTNQFLLDLSAQATPVETNQLWRPPLTAQVRLIGDSSFARIEQAVLSAPGLDAQLTAPLSVDFTGRLRDEIASVQIELELAQLPMLATTGRVAGAVTLKRTPQVWPEVGFDLSAGALTVLGFAVETAHARGQLAWPQLELSDLTARLADGSQVTAQGRADLSARRIEEATLTAAGPFAREWLPGGFTYDSLSLTGGANGPFDALNHHGALQVNDARATDWPPAQLEVDWEGVGPEIQNCEVRVAIAEWRLALQTALTVAKSAFNVTLKYGSLTNRKALQMALTAPSTLAFARTSETQGWHGKITDFTWHGPAGELELHGESSWPTSGSGAFSLRNLRPGRLLPAPRPPWDDLLVEDMNLTGAWDAGPVEFSLTTQMRLKGDETNTLRGELQLTGDREGLHLKSLEIRDAGDQALTIRGTLPVTVEPTRGADWLQAHDEKPLSLDVATAPGARFWERLAVWTGVRVRNPEATLRVRGTLAHPHGELAARADAAEIQTVDFTLPLVEQMRLSAELTRTNALIKSFTATVEQQPVRVSGSVPLQDEFWRHPARRTLWPRLEQAGGRIEIAQASVAAFARYLPDFLSPQGLLDLDLTVQPGLTMAGYLNLTNAATRGGLPTGPIRDVRARFRFVDRRAEIEEFTGRLAGETVQVTGFLGWPAWGTPEFALRLQGRRVPLSRQAGLILRADVDVGFTLTNQSPPTLTGSLRLRDSFYLSELRDLLPGRTPTAQTRPPYFSVTEEPLAGWRLDLKVTGERGLRVRTPLFRGELSPDLHLTGTLREPRALGEVRVNEGRVQFPFASIQIEQGRVTLTQDNPYRPQLFVVGTARTFDYELRLQASGFADALDWEMSSHPPLSPEAIVLLVTAGEVPRDTVTFTDQQRAGKLMFFLGKSLFSELWLEDSAADRLTIRSGESVTRDGRETYVVEYQFADRWSLVGEYDQFNAVNAGIKWRVYSK